MAIEFSSTGRHKTRQGSWVDLDAHQELLQGESPYLMYTDPPWDNMSWWTSYHQRTTGEVLTPATQEELLTSITESAKSVTHYLLIEYGQKWRDRIRAIGADAGFESHGIVTTVYSSKKLPMDLHLFARGSLGFPDGYQDGIEGTKGWGTVAAAIQPIAVPDALVLDPCCGLGYTARACVKYGMRFAGNELLAPRLEKTRAKLA